MEQTSEHGMTFDEIVTRGRDMRGMEPEFAGVFALLRPSAGARTRV